MCMCKKLCMYIKKRCPHTFKKNIKKKKHIIKNDARGERFINIKTIFYFFNSICHERRLIKKYTRSIIYNNYSY